MTIEEIAELVATRMEEYESYCDWSGPDGDERMRKVIMSALREVTEWPKVERDREAGLS